METRCAAFKTTMTITCVKQKYHHHYHHQQYIIISGCTILARTLAASKQKYEQPKFTVTVLNRYIKNGLCLLEV
jgi:hypothetical protein